MVDRGRRIRPTKPITKGRKNGIEGWHAGGIYIFARDVDIWPCAGPGREGRGARERRSLGREEEGGQQRRTGLSFGW